MDEDTRTASAASTSTSAPAEKMDHNQYMREGAFEKALVIAQVSMLEDRFDCPFRCVLKCPRGTPASRRP